MTRQIVTPACPCGLNKSGHFGPRNGKLGKMLSLPNWSFPKEVPYSQGERPYPENAFELSGHRNLARVLLETIVGALISKKPEDVIGAVE